MDKPEGFIPLKNVERILAVTIGGLGDTILFSPVLKALRSRYPESRIEFLLASQLAQKVFARSADIDHITFLNINHSLPPVKIAKLITFALKSRMQKGFDVGVFATGLNPKLSVFLKFGAGIRNIFCAPNPPAYVTDLACNVALARRFDGSISENDTFIPLTQESRIETKEILESHGILWDEKRIISVYPSTDLWHRPRWHLWKLKEVIKLLQKKGFEGKFVVIGSSKEGEEWDQIEAEQIGEINLAGRLSILGTAWLLKKSCLALCNDGGLMHVAGAVGCPLVVIMPNAPLSYRPPGQKTVVINPRLFCSAACYPRRPKSCNISKCIDEITIDEVFQKCIDLLCDLRA